MAVRIPCQEIKETSGTINLIYSLDEFLDIAQTSGRTGLCSLGFGPRLSLRSLCGNSGRGAEGEQSEPSYGSRSAIFGWG
jgi:hypothetical protein